MGVTALVTEHDKDLWPAASHTKQPPQDTKLCEATMLRAHLSKVSFAKAAEYLARSAQQVELSVQCVPCTPSKAQQQNLK